ncbi:unnamed protein product [Peniophora sp. CBMAI 1063]|nr:unnamed protein product [Peniophora sp. CBMAI 1063]
MAIYPNPDMVLHAMIILHTLAMSWQRVEAEDNHLTRHSTLVWGRVEAEGVQSDDAYRRKIPTSIYATTWTRRRPCSHMSF